MLRRLECGIFDRLSVYKYDFGLGDDGDPLVC